MTVLLLDMAPPPAAASGLVERLREKVREMRERRQDRPELHPEQVRSLSLVYFRARDDAQASSLEVPLPGDEEVARYKEQRERMNEEAAAILDDVYGADDRLKALALRDSDGDGLADYRVSDYFGKFSEGDLDVDGDGVRNVLDSNPYDPKRGGRDTNGDGTPDANFADTNRNSLPDHLDWAVMGRDAELASIQAGLYRDFHIALVERDAEFDLPLARAVDDVIRRVYGGRLAASSGLPNLRTIAVEQTALLNQQLAEEAGTDMDAQALYNSQSLVVYDAGRGVEDPIGLLGLLVHEIGHAWHMSLDWDAAHPERENGRNDFPASVFVRTVAPFGWSTNGYFDGELSDDLPVRPQFLYTGISEPEFLYRGKSAQDWAEWLNEIYAELGEPEDYLEDERFTSRGIVGDYSLTTPYEWYGDNVLAYVLVTLEDAALAGLEPDQAASAREKLTEALRAIWPGFYHRNLGADARAYFAETFPIAQADRDLLVRRYILPIIGSRLILADSGMRGIVPAILPASTRTLTGPYRMVWCVRPYLLVCFRHEKSSWKPWSRGVAREGLGCCFPRGRREAAYSDPRGGSRRHQGQFLLAFQGQG